MIGLDTGFFVKFLLNDEKAVDIWKTVIKRGNSAVSCLSLYELNRLSLRGEIDRETSKILSSSIPYVCKIIWLDNKKILMLGSNISHSFGIPSIDSLILAGFVTSNVTKIYTTDSHFERYKKKEIRIIRLK